MATEDQAPQPPAKPVDPNEPQFHDLERRVYFLRDRGFLVQMSFHSCWEISIYKMADPWWRPAPNEPWPSPVNKKFHRSLSQGLNEALDEIFGKGKHP